MSWDASSVKAGSITPADFPAIEEKLDEQKDSSLTKDDDIKTLFF